MNAKLLKPIDPQVSVSMDEFLRDRDTILNQVADSGMLLTISSGDDRFVLRHDPKPETADHFSTIYGFLKYELTTGTNSTDVVQQTIDEALPYIQLRDVYSLLQLILLYLGREDNGMDWEVFSDWFWYADSLRAYMEVKSTYQFCHRRVNEIAAGAETTAAEAECLASGFLRYPEYSEFCLLYIDLRAHLIEKYPFVFNEYDEVFREVHEFDEDLERYEKMGRGIVPETV